MGRDRYNSVSRWIDAGRRKGERSLALEPGSCRKKKEFESGYGSIRKRIERKNSTRTTL